MCSRLVSSLEMDGATLHPPSEDCDFFTAISDPRSRDDSFDFPLDGIDLEHLSNEDLVRIMDQAPVIFKLNANAVVRLSKSLAMKSGPNVLLSEAKAMEYAANLGVLCPRVHRAFQVNDAEACYGTQGYIVMDYISGQSLDSCWELLDPETQNALSLQIAGIIEQLQSGTLSLPGPLSGGVCRGRVFTDYGDGPFESSAELNEWINSKLHMCKDRKILPSDMPDFQFTSYVLTHQDVSPRNLILDATKRIWLIDWGDAGAYPPGFEVAALRLQGTFQDFSEKVISHLEFDGDSVERLLAIKPFMLAGRFS